MKKIFHFKLMKKQPTPKEQRLIDKMIDACIKDATLPQIFMMYWWDLFNHKKRDIFVKSMLAGMSFRFAYKKAKDGIV